MFLEIAAAESFTSRKPAQNEPGEQYQLYQLQLQENKWKIISLIQLKIKKKKNTHKQRSWKVADFF